MEPYPITIVRSSLDGCLHILIEALVGVNESETTTIYGREMPRWIPLRCGHYADNTNACPQGRELLNNAGINDQVFTTCSLCDFMIFSQVRAEIVHMNGLNNFIVRGNVTQHA